LKEKTNLPILRYPLKEAQRLLEERWNLGQELLEKDIRDETALDTARNQYYSWDDYNRDLLRKLIGSDKFVDEYIDKVAFLGPDTLSGRIQEFQRDVQRKLRRIESFRDRLHLYEPETPTPVLVIHDEELKSRTSDLLAAPGNFDRVIREATTILEDRIRRKVPFDDLAKLIPAAGDQTGDALVNRLANPSSPIIVFGEHHVQTRLFRMLGAVIAYLRNPVHHAIDDSVKWSWAWSVVGLIDQLLEQVANAKYERPPDLT
jgi:hypothetical protein